LFGRLNEDFGDFPKLLAYVNSTWIDIKSVLSHVGLTR